MGWVPEGQRSGQMSYSTSTKTSTFVTIGEEDAATFEAISAGRTFEDVQAMMAFRLLQDDLQENAAETVAKPAEFLGSWDRLDIFSPPAFPSNSATFRSPSELPCNTPATQSREKAQ